MSFLLQWLVSGLAIIITAYLLPGVKLTGFFAALVTALILGLINAFIRPVLILLTLPLNILTLGLFTLVINALLIMLAAAIVQALPCKASGGRSFLAWCSPSSTTPSGP